MTNEEAIKRIADHIEVHKGVLDSVVWLITRWDEREMQAEDYGKTWFAYRRKPEEGTK